MSTEKNNDISKILYITLAVLFYPIVLSIIAIDFNVDIEYGVWIFWMYSIISPIGIIITGMLLINTEIYRNVILGEVAILLDILWYIYFLYSLSHTDL